jgi:hypothetical protein
MCSLYSSSSSNVLLSPFPFTPRFTLPLISFILIFFPLWSNSYILIIRIYLIVGFATFLKFYNMSNIDRSIISYDEGWDYIQNKGIKKLLQSLPNPRFTSEDCSMLYTYVICHTLWRTNIFQNIYVLVSGTCRYRSHVSVPHR